MTKKQLIKELNSFPDEMPIMICIPSIILDDGYIEETKVCHIDNVFLAHNRPAIMLDYNRYNPVDE
jgi:hypothetical protein